MPFAPPRRWCRHPQPPPIWVLRGAFALSFGGVIDSQRGVTLAALPIEADPAL